MDLRSGYPFWLVKNGLLGTYPSLTTDEACEVVIIGGGITGALAAYYFTRAGIETIVLDKRNIASGSTAASTSLLQHAIDVELSDLIGRVGEQSAVTSYRLGLDAISTLEEIALDINCDCGFTRRDTLYLAHKLSHVTKLKKEFQCRRQYGFPVTYLESHDIEDYYPFCAPGAILSSGDAEVDVYRLTHALIADSCQDGLRVYDRTAVKEIRNTENGVLVSTERGPKVQARQVVFATGYESEQYLPKGGRSLHSTFAAVSEPIIPFPEWPGRCLIWDTGRPYFYLRTTPDNRIIIGGEDEPFSNARRRDGLIVSKTASLVRQFNRLLPEIEFEVAYAWAGTFGETKDGLAYIGRAPEWPNAYFALGYGGNGITMGVAAAKIITDDYLGIENNYAKIFRFGR